MTLAQLPEGYSVRAATMADASASSDLFNACELQEIGESDYSPGEVEEEWSNLNIGERVALVQSPDGLLAGSLVMRSRGDVVHEADIYVHPHHTGRGIGSYLVLLSEARAESWLNTAPKGIRVVIRNTVHSHNQAANDLLRSQGYEPVRNFLRMEILLNGAPKLANLPTGFELRESKAGVDEPILYETIQDAFEDHWSFGPSTFEEWKERRALDPTLSFLISQGDTVVASLVSRTIVDDLGWIGDLGVRKPWRRQGLGSALLQRAFVAFFQRGIRRIALGVDTQNADQATQLYERAGMRMTRNFVIYEKELRAGISWEH